MSKGSVVLYALFAAWCGCVLLAFAAMLSGARWLPGLLRWLVGGGDSLVCLGVAAVALLWVWALKARGGKAGG